MGGNDEVKEVAKVLFAGLLWASLICFCDLYVSLSYDGSGITALFSLIVISCVFGLLGPFLENLIVMIVFWVIFTILYICAAIYWTDLICIIIGSLTIGVGFCYWVCLAVG